MFLNAAKKFIPVTSSAFNIDVFHHNGKSLEALAVFLAVIKARCCQQTSSTRAFRTFLVDGSIVYCFIIFLVGVGKNHENKARNVFFFGGRGRGGD